MVRKPHRRACRCECQRRGFAPRYDALLDTLCLGRVGHGTLRTSFETRILS